MKATGSIDSVTCDRLLMCAWHYSKGSVIFPAAATCVYVRVCQVKAMFWLPLVLCNVCDWRQQTSVCLEANGHSVRLTGSVKVTDSSGHLNGNYCTHIVYIQSPFPQFHKSCVQDRFVLHPTPPPKDQCAFRDCIALWIVQSCEGEYILSFWLH